MNPWPLFFVEFVKLDENYEKLVLLVVWEVGDVNKASWVVDFLGCIVHRPVVFNVHIRLPFIYFRFRSENNRKWSCNFKWAEVFLKEFKVLNVGIAIFELGKGLTLSPKNEHFTMFSHVLTSTISGSQILSLGTVMFSIPP